MLNKVLMKNISMLSLALIPIVSVNAKADSIINELAGSSEKIWQVQAFDIDLGTSSKCTEGLQYIFDISGTLTIRFCNNAKVEISQYPFHTEADGIDKFIFYDGQKYRLVYSKKTNYLGLEEEELVIREDGSKQNATIDIIMIHIP
ncbi:hypothetical protein [Pseudoalteromonas rubra]|uniref:hypothetical protein n=1 Tax=Pseudoalteromonas rubra TaxID=43658 RepID=UPI002DBE1F19|nr:hypothetical protein [Pseudoalteromonas rubra]MEC4087163.1 hypothetical protein [Pseudoalteromonas rubra]